VARSTASADSSAGYEGIAASFAEYREAPTSGYVGASAVRRWARQLARGAAVLELGCGTGVPITRELRGQRLTVFAVEASPTLAVAFARRFPDVPLLREAAETSSLFGRRFDAALAWGLVFLLPEPSQHSLIERVAAALEPEGRFLFTAPRETGRWNDVMTGQMSQSLGAAAYRSALAAAGFASVREFDSEGIHYYEAVAPR